MRGSEYYLAQEIATTYTGMLIAVPECDWTVFTEASQTELRGMLLNLARRVALAKFKKTKEAPKKHQIQELNSKVKPLFPRQSFSPPPHLANSP